MGTNQLVPRGGLGGVRPYSGRMNIDLPGFPRRKFLSKYSLQRRSGARLVNLGDGDLLPRLLDQRGSQSRDAGGGIQTFTKVPSPRVWGLKVSAGEIIVHTELGDLQDTEGLPVEPRFYAKKEAPLSIDD